MYCRSSLSIAQSYASSLGTNNSLLLGLATNDLPSFGVDPSTIRSVVLNSSSITVSGSTLVITVQYTTILVSALGWGCSNELKIYRKIRLVYFKTHRCIVQGSSTPLALPVTTSPHAKSLNPSGRRRLYYSADNTSGFQSNPLTARRLAQDGSQQLPQRLSVALEALMSLSSAFDNHSESAESLIETLSYILQRETMASTTKEHNGRVLLQGSTSPGGCSTSWVSASSSNGNITVLANPQSTCQTPNINNEGLMMSTIVGALTDTIDASAVIQVNRPPPQSLTLNVTVPHCHLAWIFADSVTINAFLPLQA
jgi:hypothetical protein